MDEAVEWVKRCPNPMDGESEIEIRQVFEAEEFGDAIDAGAARAGRARARPGRQAALGERSPHDSSQPARRFSRGARSTPQALSARPPAATCAGFKSGAVAGLRQPDVRRCKRGGWAAFCFQSGGRHVQKHRRRCRAARHRAAVCLLPEPELPRAGSGRRPHHVCRCRRRRPAVARARHRSVRSPQGQPVPGGARQPAVDVLDRRRHGVVRERAPLPERRTPAAAGRGPHRGAGQLLPLRRIRRPRATRSVRRDAPRSARCPWNAAASAGAHRHAGRGRSPRRRRPPRNLCSSSTCPAR